MSKDLKDVMRKLAEDPTAIDELDDDTIMELSKKVNPAGTVAPIKKSYAVMSIANMRDWYTKKLMMTSLISFMYRRLFEYKPEHVVDAEISLARKLTDISAKKRPPERDAKEWEREIQAERDEITRRVNEFKDAYGTQARSLLTEFLDSIFKFNPDKHVRRAPTAYSADAVELIRTNGHADPEAARVVEAIKKDAVEARTALDIAGYVDDAAMSVFRHARAIADAADAVGVAQDTTSIRAHASTIRAHMKQLETFARNPLCKHTEIEDVVRIDPPADVFYHFDRYMDAHYETLRMMTDALYQPAPDIDNVVVYYDAFDKQAEAEAYVRAHESDFHMEPKIVENGAVTVLGPFRENRERVDFYNKSTEVLRAMVEQIESDHKLGKDIAEHRIVDSKRRNIREAGPDDADLKDYIQARGIVGTLGRRPHLSEEDKRKLAEAEEKRAIFETPDGALAVRVLKPVLDEDGIPRDLQQSFFHSEIQNVAHSEGSDSSAPSASTSSGQH